MNTFQMQIKENRTPFLIVLQGNRRDKLSEKKKKPLCKILLKQCWLRLLASPLLKVFHWQLGLKQWKVLKANNSERITEQEKKGEMCCRNSPQCMHIEGEFHKHTHKYISKCSFLHSSQQSENSGDTQKWWRRGLVLSFLFVFAINYSSWRVYVAVV